MFVWMRKGSVERVTDTRPTVAAGYEIINWSGDPPVEGQIWDGESFADPEIVEPDAAEERPVELSFKRFIVLVQTATGMTDEQAMDILVDSTKPSIRKLRFLMTDLDVPLTRDDPIVHSGLDTLVSESYFTEAGKAATLSAWPTE
ncbi:MAG: hypothetical protein KAG70_14295 [Alcanivorax sp.]|uniref:hypothetical protein n=1 Tax=Fulvimarina manganoxydans TaxID=937218 RepID=UPI0023548A41|nr:hypothetical protein [Fulvimarina manganoxydans]MCK5887653.1 hypothetical protein [Alcanivorax sp.]MCK5932934.1 hypothetical protein [Fulvimarina manganoxydans]